MTPRSIIDKKAPSLEDYAQIFAAERKSYPYDIAIIGIDSEPDQKLSRAVQKALENYKFPKAFKEHQKTFQLRVILNPKGQACEQALFLVPICSLKTPRNPQVEEAISAFIRHRAPQYIVPVLIEGEVWESYPFGIRDLKIDVTLEDGTIQEVPYEHLAADLRPESFQGREAQNYRTISDPKQVQSLVEEAVKILETSEIYRILAGVFGCSYGDLKDREQERKRALVIKIFRVVSAALAIFSIFIFTAYRKERASKRLALENSAQVLLNAADDKLNTGDKLQSILMAQEAMDEIQEDFDNYEKLHMQETRIYRDALDSSRVFSKTKIATHNYYGQPTLHPDQNRILVPQGIQDICLYEVSNAKPIKTYHGHTQMVTSVLFTQDGQSFISAGMDRKILKWNLEGDKPLFEIISPTVPLYVSLSYNESKIHVVDIEDNAYTLRSYDAQTGSETDKPLVFDGHVASISFSSGQDLALVSDPDNYKGKSLYLVDLEKRQILSPIPERMMTDDLDLGLDLDGLEGQAMSIPYRAGCFSQDGTSIYALGDTVTRRDARSGAIFQTYEGSFPLDKLEIYENLESEKVYIGQNINVAVFDRVSGLLLGTLDAGGSLEAFCLNPEGDVLMISSEGTLALAQNDQVVSNQNLSYAKSTDLLTFARSDDYAVGYSRAEKSITIYQIRPETEDLNLEGAIAWISTDKALAAFKKDDGTYWVRDNQTGDTIRAFNLIDLEQVSGKSFTNGFTLSDDGRYLAGILQSTDDSKMLEVVVFDMETGLPTRSLSVPFTNTFYTFLPDGKSLLISDSMNPPLIFSLDNGTESLVENLPPVMIKSICFADDRFIAINTASETGMIYDFEGEGVVQTYGGQVVYLVRKGKGFMARGIYNDSLFESSDGEIFYHPADPDFSAITSIQNDFLSYNSEKELVLAMRNGSDMDKSAQGFLVDFKTGAIIKTFTVSRPAEGGRIFTDPSGNFIYYDLGTISQLLNGDSLDYDRSDVLEITRTGVYPLKDEKTLESAVEDFTGSRSLEDDYRILQETGQ